MITIGTVFHRLTVISLAPSIKRRSYTYLCKCECGIEKVVNGQALVDSKTKSCGCLRKFNCYRVPGHITYRSQRQDYVVNARKRNLVFNLNLAEFISVTSKDCHYCGAKPVHKNEYVLRKGGFRKMYRGKAPDPRAVERAWIKLNGIDRIKNEIGYELSNCVPCCEKCNKSKGTSTYADFIAYLDNLVTFRGSL